MKRRRRRTEEDDGGLSSACHRSQPQTESGLYNYGLSPHQLREGKGRGWWRGALIVCAGAWGGSYKSAVFSSNCVLSSFAFDFRVPDRRVIEPPGARGPPFSDFCPISSRKVFVLTRRDAMPILGYNRASYVHSLA